MEITIFDSEVGVTHKIISRQNQNNNHVTRPKVKHDGHIRNDYYMMELIIMDD